MACAWRVASLSPPAGTVTAPHERTMRAGWERVSGRGQRETDREAAAGARLGLDGERSAMGDHDGARDRQPEAGPAGIATAGRVETHEGLEDARGIGGIDAHP